MQIGKKLRAGNAGQLIVLCPGCNHNHELFVEGKEPNEYSGQVFAYNGNPDAPTFTPSLTVSMDDGLCHSVVEDGFMTFSADSYHTLAGQRVEIADLTDDL